MNDYDTLGELLDDTVVYCARGSIICEGTGDILSAWWLSELALTDVEQFYSVW